MIDAAPTVDKFVFVTAPEQLTIADEFQNLLSFENTPSLQQLKKACRLIIDGTIAQEGTSDDTLKSLHTTLSLDYPYAVEPEAIVNLDLYVNRALHPGGWLQKEIPDPKLAALYVALQENLKTYPAALALLRTHIPDQG